jgi:hypothetical protein
MKNYLNNVHKIAYWTLPKGVYDFIKEKGRQRQDETVKANERPLLTKNQTFLNKHTGERCFILATGPSIKRQNIAALRDEHCLAVSDFYKHPDYAKLKPGYYFIAPMHAPFTEADGINRLNELMAYAPHCVGYFLGLRDRHLLEKSSLAPHADQSFFLKLNKLHRLPVEIDLTKPLPNVTSATIMALWSAIYMGFAEIYLLGCDHNFIWQWDGSKENKMEHFYEGEPSIGYLPFDVDRALQGHLKVRQQYRWTHQLALAQNTKIYNASPSSYIDIFPRVRLEDVI